MAPSRANVLHALSFGRFAPRRPVPGSATAAALPPLSAISRWSVLPNSAHSGAGRRLGVRRHEPSTTRPSIAIWMPRVLPELLEALAVDVGHEVAEAVHAQHLPGQALLADLRLRNLQHCHCETGRPIAVSSMPLASHAGRRREAVAAFEGLAHRRARVPPLGQVHDLSRRRLVEHERQARRCPARRTGSRPCRRPAPAAPSRRPGPPRPERSCPAGK